MCNLGWGFRSRPRIRILNTALNPLSTILANYNLVSSATPLFIALQSNPCFLHSTSATAPALSRQGRDTGLDGFELLLQFHPNPVLKLSPIFALGKALRFLDLAIRDVLPVGFFPYTGSIDQRARTDLRSAGEYPDKKIYKDAAILTVKLAVAES